MTQYTQRESGTANDGYFAGSWFPDGGWLLFAWNQFLNAVNYSAVRFTNVTVPQGTTITSAYLTLTAYQTDTDTVDQRIRGFAEDNTANFSSDPSGRSKTSAQRTQNQAGITNNQTYTYDVTAIVQEIVNRGGWSSGNALGFYFDLNSGLSGSSHTLHFHSESSAPTKAPYLEINWGGPSPSASTSPSSSVSPSASPSVSPSASVSPSSSPSPSPMPPPNPAAMKIGKPGVNVLTNSDVEKLKFSSEFGTLKYFDKEALNLSFDASTGDITCRGKITHNLGYYPYVEVYVSVYIGSPTGVYEYCPFFGSGASVAYNANVKIDSSKITCYGEISGVSSSVWHFDFLVFIYKNKVDL